MDFSLLIPFIADFLLFALKTVMVVTGFIAVLGSVFYFASRGRGKSLIEVENLNERFSDLRHFLKSQLLHGKQLKEFLKAEKRAQKKEKPKDRRVFVLDFDGDIRASEVEDLREEITAVISSANVQAGDEVIVRLESPGGMVTSYGLAASQLRRLKENGLKLTVCVDKVAASGGYMMACVADWIVAAPFAVVGSIGVVAQVPNFNRILRNHDVDFREVTAGQYKRTVSLLGEITESGLAKFREQIEDTHVLFKRFVQENRPSLNIDAVATGEHWYGTQAISLGLVDELRTSDDVLYSLYDKAELVLVKCHKRKSPMEKLMGSAASAAVSSFDRLWTRFTRLTYGA